MQKIAFLTGSCVENVVEFYSIWPYFACMVLLLALACAPFFAIADTPPNPRGNRISNLDDCADSLRSACSFTTQPFITNISKMANGYCPPRAFIV
jgi:hypothetical protein